MAKLLKLRRGTTTQHGSFTGAEGELTIDTTKDTAVVHDGSQAGGRPLAREDMSNVSSSSIVNQITGSALAGVKVQPNFGSQDIETTGKVKFANVYSNESDLPSASTYHGMFAHVHSTGLAYYAHGGNWIKLAKLDAPDFTSGIDVTGNSTVTGDLAVTGSLAASNIDANAGLDISIASGTTSAMFGSSSQINGIQNMPSAAGVPFVVGQDTGSLRSAIFAGNVDVGAGLDVTGNITATGTVDGRDVAADGTKLDGIDSGAKDDQTAAEIISLLNNQNVYVGTGLLGSDSTDAFQWSNNTHCNLFINNNNEFRFEADGDFHADGDIIAQSTTISSDIRLKENVQVVPDALDKVESLRGVTFDWKRDGTPSAGVIAQEVQGVLPEAVKEVTPVKGGDSHLSVNYHALTSILIEAIKELKAEVEELKGGK